MILLVSPGFVSFRFAKQNNPKIIEIHNNIEKNSFSTPNSGRFTIYCPRSNVYFALRIQKKIMSNFWYRTYRARRGRCSIRIALSKLDFNVQAVSACICKQCHGRRITLHHLPQNLKVFIDFIERQLRCKCEERVYSFLNRKNGCKKQIALI